MLKRTLITLLVLSLVPVSALAQKVAVLPVVYQRAGSGEKVPDAAAKVAAKVAEGVEEAGFETADRAAVDVALTELADPDGCSSPECLGKLCEKLGVDEAMHVSVTDDDQTSYGVSIAMARRDGLVEDRTDGFFVVLEWIRGSVALALQKPANTPVPAPAEATADEGLDEEEGPAAPEEDKKDEKDETAPEEGEKDGLSPIPFYVSAAVTGALVIGWGITDIVVHSKYKDLEDGTGDRDSWDDDRDSAESLQTVDRVLLGVSAAGLVTTGVLFFLTDFDKDKGEVELTTGVKGAAPMVVEDGGGLVLTGRF